MLKTVCFSCVYQFHHSSTKLEPIGFEPIMWGFQDRSNRKFLLSSFILIYKKELEYQIQYKYLLYHLSYILHTERWWESNPRPGVYKTEVTVSTA